MIEFFTDIWDQPMYEYRTKGAGTDMIIGPFITILGCMTPEQTDQMMKENIISGGFSRRCLFVYSCERGDPVAIPVMTPKQHAAKEYLVTYGRQLATIKGAFEMTPDALAYFTNWYDNINYKIRAKPLSNIMKAYFRTKDCLLIKLAMLYALGSYSDPEHAEIELKIEVEHLETVLEVMKNVEPHIEKVFDGIGRNPLAGVKARMAAMIDEQGGSMETNALVTAMFEHAEEEEVNKALTQLLRENKHRMFDRTVNNQPRRYVDRVIS